MPLQKPSMTYRAFVHLTFSETTLFARQITELMSDEELSALQWVLIANPDRGDLIRGSGGLRKIRCAGSGRGKRGGLRVILEKAIDGRKKAQKAQERALEAFSCIAFKVNKFGHHISSQSFIFAPSEPFCGYSYSRF
jgi:hypothetical protein